MQFYKWAKYLLFQRVLGDIASDVCRKLFPHSIILDHLVVCLTNLLSFYDELTAAADKGNAVDIVYLTSIRPLTLLP